MQWTDDVRIETPEQIDVALEVAGLGSRFVAQVIDWLIQWAILGIAAVVVLIAVAVFRPALKGDSLEMILLALLVVMVFVLFLGFDTYFEVRWNGQTPGKKTAGIRAVREGGGPLDFRSACIRNLIGLADFLPAFYILGAFLILLNRRGQRLGDMAAGTIVIRERSLAPPEEPHIDLLVSGECKFTQEQLAACTREDRFILRSFFQRYLDMEVRPRRDLAVRLAETFLRKTAYQASSPIDAECFLAALYRELGNWAEHG